MNRTIAMPVIVIILFLATGVSIIVGQEKSKKGLVVENAPVKSPCNNLIPELRPKEEVNSGAKGLFYDPNSGALVSAQKPKPNLTKRRSPNHKPASTALKSDGQQPQTTTNTGLKYWIELIKPDGQSVRVARERTFRSGERIRFHFESNVNGYIAMALLDENCNATTLFPTTSIRSGDNFIQRGKNYTLPSAESWLRFDQQAGVERLMVFFSQSRQAIDNLGLKPSMSQDAVAQLTNKAQEGSKGLFIEVEESESADSKPAKYYVNPVSNPNSYVVVEIYLDHAP